MNINTITQFNIVSKENLNNNRNNDFNNKRKRSDRILYYSLGGLAAIALGGLFYKNKSGIKKQNLIKVCTYQDLRQSTSSKQLSEVEAEAGRLNNELFKQFEISHDTDIFKRFVALMHLTDSKAVELPKMVITNAPESTLNDIGNLFSKDFKFEQRNLLYKSNPKDFIQKVKDHKFTSSGKFALTLLYFVAGGLLLWYTIYPPTWFGLERWTVALLCIIVIGLTLLNKDSITHALNNKYINGSYSI